MPLVFSTSEYETKSLACKIGKGLVPPQVFALVGELGSGKTVFAQGLAEGVGVTEPVTSPTFVIWNRYAGGRGILFDHVDLYRLAGGSSIQDLGWFEWLDPKSIMVIEWADRLDPLPEGAHVVRFSHGFQKTRSIELPREFL